MPGVQLTDRHHHRGRYLGRTGSAHLPILRLVDLRRRLAARQRILAAELGAVGRASELTHSRRCPARQRCAGWWLSATSGGRWVLNARVGYHEITWHRLIRTQSGTPHRLLASVPYGLFRDTVEFCSGLVDLVVCVGGYLGCQQSRISPGL